MIDIGFVNIQLCILPCVGLAVIRTGRPIGNSFVAEGLDIQFAFHIERLIKDINCSASAAYILVAYG